MPEETSQSRVIRISCYRADSTYELASAEFATAISTAPASPTTLLGFYDVVVNRGGSLTELAPLYKHSAFVADFKAALLAGDETTINALIAVAKELNPIGDTTLNAINATINAQRPVDAVALEQFPDGDVIMPVTITAAMVDLALGR